LPKWLAGFSGVFVDSFGYQSFFIGTAIIGVPVLILIWLAMRLKVVEFKRHDSAVAKETSHNLL
jgi:PAT family beta-lactamase induction signal transducer AmpG